MHRDLGLLVIKKYNLKDFHPRNIWGSHFQLYNLPVCMCIYIPITPPIVNILLDMNFQKYYLMIISLISYCLITIENLSKPSKQGS